MKKYSRFLRKFTISLILIFAFQNMLTAGATSIATYNQIDEKTKEINVNINLDKNDFVYQDYINISCDNPQIEIASWKIPATPVKHFSKEFRDTKNIFNKNFVIKIITKNKTDKPVQNTHLHISFYLNSKNSIVEEVVPFDQKNIHTNNSNTNTLATISSNANTENITRTVNGHYTITISKSSNSENTLSENINTKNTANKEINTNNEAVESIASDSYKLQDNQENTENIINNKNNDSNNTDKPNKNEKEEVKTWTQYLQNLLKTTESIWIRLLLALILGILLSLTPCIYPMIPITVGIIQSHGSKSFISNLFLSLIYTMGIAITFAILGLIAAFTGAIFGTILSSPIFVLILVSIMVYLALSMFGFYEIYMPKFMSSGNGSGSKKSILSVFLLGIASGTIASPCVSPGLILLLSIVTAIGSKLLGFLLLFTFGLGLGTPLIIAGTFSGSINKLPRAGMWMLEIKKIFGLLIFGVCFYFLSNIMPADILSWIMASFMMVVGIFYLYTIKPYDSKLWKIIKNLIGIAFCASSIILIFNVYKEKYITKNLQSSQESRFWQEDFDSALIQAKQENKKIFIDLTTDTCSICKAIGKKVFTNTAITNELKDKFINIKITVSDMSAEPFATLNKKFKILGFPTFLLIDPNTDTIINRWSSEFYYMSEPDLIKMFRELN